MGLRNPWRFSFDRATGDLWIGDVGQDTIEEVDRLPRDAQSGANLGWSMYEGNNCFHPPCDPTGITFPVHVDTHASGACAVIGGDVYRGSCFPDLQGRYFFTDFCAPPCCAPTSRSTALSPSMIRASCPEAVLPACTLLPTASCT